MPSRSCEAAGWTKASRTSAVDGFAPPGAGLARSIGTYAHASLECSEHRGDRLGCLGEEEGDTVARPAAGLDERTGEAVRKGLELAVRERAGAGDDRRRVATGERRVRDSLVEERGHADERGLGVVDDPAGVHEVVGLDAGCR